MTIFDFLLIGTALGLLCGICVGIIHEEKLVRFERAVWIGILMTVRDWAEDKLKKETEGGAATWTNRTPANTAARF